MQRVSLRLSRGWASTSTDADDEKYNEKRHALLDFGRQVRCADLAVVFFAGHGIQMGGENWLIQIDAQPATDLNVANEAIGLLAVTQSSAASNPIGSEQTDGRFG
jgi:uncharacterized caspase-like protein